MSAVAAYAPRPTRRARRTKAEMAAIRDGLINILEEAHPATVRQTFYQAVTKGLIDKTEVEYKGTVVRLLCELRRTKVIPFDWIADSTRWMRKPETHDSMEDALRLTAETYRRALWQHAPVSVEVWLEKDALAGVLYSVTAEYDVPLMVTRGYPSLTFLQGAAESFEDDGRTVCIYYLGDWDPSGVDISRVVERDLRAWAPSVEINFERVAVTREQIGQLDLPTRPTKKTDTRAKHFKGASVEVDAIPPDKLRAIARESIEQHLDAATLVRTKLIELQEQESLLRFAKTFGRRASRGGR